MIKLRIWPVFLLFIFFSTLYAAAQESGIPGEGRVIVTITPKKDNAVPPAVQNSDVGVKVNGKTAKVTEWRRLDSPDDSVELVLLIDDAARSSLGTQLEEMADFLSHMPPNTRALVAYMSYGRAIYNGQFTSDPAALKQMLRLPAGPAGVNASPYFSLSDLAKHWPSNNPKARRIVVMITDGIEPYFSGLGEENPYVKAAMDDAARGGIIVYTLYWKSKTFLDNTMIGNSYGQNQLSSLTESTGGRNLWNGNGNPVSFGPFFDELTKLLRNQYELRFDVPLKNKPEIEYFKLHLSAPGAEVDAPQEVYIYPKSIDLNTVK